MAATDKANTAAGANTPGAESGGFARYGWIVTHDELWEGPGDVVPCAVGKVGPDTLSPQMRERLAAGHGLVWRAWDDDGVLYYRGRIILPDDADELECVAPLREFAVGDGAVRMQFRDQYGTHRYQL